MVSAAPLLRAGYVGIALADSWLAGRSAEQRRARRLTKPALMPLLAASVVTDPRSVSSPLRRSTPAAQAGAWAGDVALLGSGTRPFLAGVAAFAVGHVVSLRGLQRVSGPGPLRRTRGARAAAGAWLGTAPALAYAVGRRDPSLVGPVAGYSVLLAGLAARAGHLDPTLPVATRRCAAAGAWTFLASDTLLATRTFVLPGPSPLVDRAVMLTYTAAQLLFAEATADT